MNKSPSSIYTIRFNDCDPFGHLNNARYIDYFLNAREDHLSEAYELKMSDYYLKGISWVVGSHEITYSRPAAYNEKVIINSTLIQATTDSLLVEMQMLDAAQTHLKSFIWTKFIPVNIKTGRREKHPDDFMEFVRKIELSDIDVTGGYKQRLKEILQPVKIIK